MTDWWCRSEQYREILAGNDLKMATGYPERVKEAVKLGALGRDDLLVCAKRVLETIFKILNIWLCTGSVCPNRACYLYLQILHQGTDIIHGSGPIGRKAYNGTVFVVFFPETVTHVF